MGGIGDGQRHALACEVVVAEVGVGAAAPTAYAWSSASRFMEIQLISVKSTCVRLLIAKHVYKTRIITYVYVFALPGALANGRELLQPALYNAFPSG